MSQEVRESLHCASGTQGQSPLALTAAQLLREWKQRNCCDKTHGRHHVASYQVLYVHVNEQGYKGFSGYSKREVGVYELSGISLQK